MLYWVDTLQENTVDSGFYHTNYFKEKCDCEQSVTISGVTVTGVYCTNKNVPENVIF